MKLLKLQLENFRNHSQYFYDFQDHKTTVFLGKNGLGKTNILEAIYLLSLGKSFRTNQLPDLIEHQKDYLRATAVIEQDQEEVKLEFFFSSQPKRQTRCRRNEVTLSAKKFIGQLKTVLFHPEDLNILYLAPELRRRYLNILLCQTDPLYLDALMKYRKVIKQRNALLRTIRELKFQDQPTQTLRADLDVWDNQLSHIGSYLIQQREQFIEFLKQHLTTYYQEIAQSDDQVAVTYQKKIAGDYLQALQERRDIDIIQARTTRGPHRDDLLFTINGQEITSSASRGEFRTLLLALKLAEIRYIKDLTGQDPVLLLDDVFSELDPERRKRLFKAISPCQVIITSTDLNEEDTALCENLKICYNLSS